MNHDHLTPTLPRHPSALTPSKLLKAFPILRAFHLLVQPQVHGRIIQELAEKLPPLTFQLHPKVPIYQRRLMVQNHMRPLNLLLPAKACLSAKLMTQTTNLVTCTIFILTEHHGIYEY